MILMHLPLPKKGAKPQEESFDPGRLIQGGSVESSSISKEIPNVLSTRPNDSENNMASTKVIHDALARNLSAALFYKNAYVIVCNYIQYKVLLQICLAIQCAFYQSFYS